MATKKNSSSRSKSRTTTKANTRNSKNSKNRVASKAMQEKQAAFRQEICLLLLVLVSILLFLSNLGIGGMIGNTVSGFFFGLFGIISYVFPIILCIGTFFVVANKENGFAIVKIIAFLIFTLFICMLMSLIIHGDAPLNATDSFKESAVTKLGGGFIGGALSSVFIAGFDYPGAWAIDVIVLIISLVLITERSFMNGMKRGGKKVYETAKESNERYMEYREHKLEEKAQRRMDRKVTGVSADIKIPDAKDGMQNVLTDEINELHENVDIDMPDIQSITATKLVASVEPVFPPEPEKAFQGTDDFVIRGDFDKEENHALDVEVASAPITEKAKAEAVNEKPAKTDVQEEVNQVTETISKVEEVVNYKYPPIDLLKSVSGKKTGNTEIELRETAKKLQETLANFGVNVKVTDISCGPAVTRYEIQPEMGVKVSKIVNLADDIKLYLEAADIRIEAPIPGKAAVGIEVPNKTNVMVSFRELIESEEFKKANSKISFAVGKDIAGKVTIHDIAKMPHVLIAGATGSGKSVCINTIIMSILYKADPNEVKLIMIDPKVVELSVYNGIPHLLIPVVTDPKKAAGALQWAVNEMTERYEKFAECGVREIHGYNKKIAELTPVEGTEMPKKLPQIIVIVDELADLMMVASGEVEEAICRLAQLARAAGIHLVIATQRPSVNVITGLIKANMPSRIAFAVTSGIDSRTILDMNGAEKLLGKGDMLFNPQGIPKPIRVQGAFVSDEEVARVVDFVKSNNQSAYREDIQSKVESLQSSSNTTVSISNGDSGDDGRDSYFVEAARILLDKDKASIGMLQRYLKVGFNRAARIMDQLEEAGIVGPEEGTKPRKILMSPEQFEQYVDEYL